MALAFFLVMAFALAMPFTMAIMPVVAVPIPAVAAVAPAIVSFAAVSVGSVVIPRRPAVVVGIFAAAGRGLGPGTYRRQWGPARLYGLFPPGCSWHRFSAADSDGLPFGFAGLSACAAVGNLTGIARPLAGFASLLIGIAFPCRLCEGRRVEGQQAEDQKKDKFLHNDKQCRADE